MNAASWCILAAVGVILALAVAYLVHRGRVTGDECAGCALSAFCRKN